MSSPCYGRLVWVELPDPQGRNPKCRPAVILTPTDQIVPDGEVWVVGVSTQLDAAPAEVQVELQYDPRGNCRTQLRERCAAVCVKVPLSAVRQYAGVVPGRQMIEINQKVGSLPT